MAKATHNYAQEIVSGMTSVGFVSESGSVLIWNRFTGGFRFALSNTAGTTSTSVDHLPLAETFPAARIVADAFFAPRTQPE